MDLGGLIMTSEGGARRAPDPTQVSALGSATCDPWRDSLRVGASCVRLPLSSAELVRGGVRPQPLASLALQVSTPQLPTETPAGRRPSTPVPPSAPGGQPVPRRPHGTSSAEHQLQLARLPVRSPGQHMHPQLRRAAWAGPSDRAVRSA